MNGLPQRLLLLLLWNCGDNSAFKRNDSRTASARLRDLRTVMDVDHRGVSPET